MSGKIYFISDTHFYHKNIIGYCRRPFRTVDEMNSFMIQKWNETVDEDDYIYHLGDVGLGRKEKLIPIIQSLNGHKILVMGNHDHGTITSYKDMGFEEVRKQPVRLTYENKTIWLSHFPIDKLENWEYNVFGHIHNGHNNLIIPHHNFCVCVERTNYIPVELEVLVKEFNL